MSPTEALTLLNETFTKLEMGTTETDSAKLDAIGAALDADTVCALDELRRMEKAGEMPKRLEVSNLYRRLIWKKGRMYSRKPRSN